MLRLRLALFASSIAVSAGAMACIDEPTFVLDESASSTSPTTPVSGEGDDEMILVPATTFPTPGTLEPTAPGPGRPKDDDDDDDDGKGKGRGGGGSDGGGDVVPPSGSSTTVPAFWIDAREVSARAYAACVAEGRCTSAGGGPDCTVAAGLDDHPANCVSIDQARAFCAWRGKRLVTNDEWTAASAGADLRPYPWGADAPDPSRLNAEGVTDGWARTAPRGSFTSGRSPEGVWDLAGNVAEWVDVAGATIARGGSFADRDAASVSSLAVRTVAGADATVGFRCAKTE